MTHPGSTTGPSLRTTSSRWRSVTEAAISVWFAGATSSDDACADEPMVDGQQLLDLPGHPDAGVHEHDEEVAHALDVAHKVRREHDAHVVARNRRHQQSEEFAARERVEAGHRLVEQEQLGALGERDREGQLGTLATRQPARRAGEG